MLWAGGSASLARARHAAGAEVVAWPGADTAALVRADVPARPLEAVIGEAGLAAATAAGRAWARLWGRVPLLDGQSFRDLVEWRDTSLLWLAEGFIRDQTAGPLCARLAETVLGLLEVTRADEVDAVGLGRPEAVILARACTARGVLLHGPTPDARPLRGARVRRGGRLHRLGGLLAPRRRPPLPPPIAGGEGTDAPPLLVVPSRESAVPPLSGLLEPAARDLGMPVVIVPLADLPRFETRRVRRAETEADAVLRRCRTRLRGGPGLHESYAHRGVGFADLAGGDLDAILLGHLPDAVRMLEAAIELVAAPDRPGAVLVVGGRRDDRRTLVAACGTEGVPAVVVHFEPVGPEEVDRDDAGPRAAATFVWEPGSDPAPALARLREVRARVGAR